MKDDQTPTLILWDIDGTLLLTGGAGDRAMQQAFETVYKKKVGIEIHPHGKTDPQIITEIYVSLFHQAPKETDIQNIKNAYLKVFEKEILTSQRFKVMPHVQQTLSLLQKKNNIVQGLATGNFESSSYMKLKKAEIAHFFTFGGFGDDSYDRQELTHMALKRGVQHMGKTPAQIYLIGDTVNDIRCGKGIGATTIAVCTCVTPRADLESAGADYVLNDLSELCRTPIV